MKNLLISLMIFGINLFAVKVLYCQFAMVFYIFSHLLVFCIILFSLAHFFVASKALGC